jgi:hypothetical protein
VSLIDARNLTKTYRAGDLDVPALRGIDFAIDPIRGSGFPIPENGERRMSSISALMRAKTFGSLFCHRR